MADPRHHAKPANQPIYIISGLAFGIDAEAHKSTLKYAGNGLRTIAVLGGGCDPESVYPRAHQVLAEKILESGGALVSEYPPGTYPTKYSFPMRNRIISGLSSAVIVIEAAEKSGALITARHALEQNKDVFAVPGSIFSKNSAGTNRLIRDGALPLCQIEDLQTRYFQLQKKSGILPINITKSTDPIEQKILTIIDTEPVDIEEIISKTKLNISELNAALARLQIQRKIKNSGTQSYYKI